MRILTTVLGVLIAFFTAQSVSAKEWRGIMPLRSVRADVERLLGPPSQGSPHGSYYSLRNEIAVIHFQSISCKDSCGFGWNVPIGSVISIGVIPKGDHGKEKFDSGVDFKVENGGAGFVYYTNEHDGLTLEKYKERITLIIYSPTEKEAALQCPSTRECIADFFPKFDEYGNLSFEDEKARLDNYVIQMKNLLGRGALVVVGENRAVRIGLLKRAERAKRYLVQKRGFEAERLLIVDGGYQTSSYTQLHLYMIGGVVGRIHLFPEKDPGPVAPNKALQLTAR
ncbi:MAG: hypothetical protein M3R52_13185 [Acidobacteriota bacterium]|nr:hypothetical protein [Acidobacteriota bacterium]